MLKIFMLFSGLILDLQQLCLWILGIRKPSIFKFNEEILTHYTKATAFVPVNTAKTYFLGLDANTWQNIGWGVAGVVLVGVGIYLLMHTKHSDLPDTGPVIPPAGDADVMARGIDLSGLTLDTPGAQGILQEAGETKFFIIHKVDFSGIWPSQLDFCRNKLVMTLSDPNTFLQFKQSMSSVSTVTFQYTGNFLNFFKNTFCQKNIRDAMVWSMQNEGKPCVIFDDTSQYTFLTVQVPVDEKVFNLALEGGGKNIYMSSPELIERLLKFGYVPYEQGIQALPDDVTFFTSIYPGLPIDIAQMLSDGFADYCEWLFYIP